ncbi:cupin domain-containing protein [Thalassotalea crassostreae]|uniref:cupin domain-containing protein n=1 Tax=Thalassotalea crassostreae TaxID=1763536 RepID=UPI0009EDD715|nr:cupin domain-containing protein [Thalassotalea crassostreae]
MKVAAEFNNREIVHTNTVPWVPSPMPGVDRRILDRVGGEVARATSIVRYAPGSNFSPHVHTGGEEFIVLEGIFQDEHGDFPVGSYIRNPPQSSHTPRSDNGCIILVKLWQFQPEDRTHVRLQMNAMAKVAIPNATGVYTTPLFKDHIEEVSLLHFDAYAELEFKAGGGAELFVLAGDITEQQDQLGLHSWARIPIGQKLKLKAGKEGAKIWLKTGHLSDVEKQIKRVENA